MNRLIWQQMFRSMVISEDTLTDYAGQPGLRDVVEQQEASAGIWFNHKHKPRMIKTKTQTTIVANKSK